MSPPLRHRRPSARDRSPRRRRDGYVPVGVRLEARSLLAASTPDPLATLAPPIGLHATTTGTLGAGSVLFYRIVSPADGRLTAQLGDLADSARLTLYVPQGKNFLAIPGVSAQNADDAINLPLSAGTDYLEVANLGGPSPFGLTTSFTPSAVPHGRVAVGSDSVAIASGDFGGHGLTDLAVADSARGTVSLLLGDGGGGFQAVATYAVPGHPVAITTNDFNGDGSTDLAVATYAPSTVSLLLGGGAALLPAATYAVPGHPVAIATYDPGDGSTSISVTLRNGSSLEFASQGNGTSIPNGPGGSGGRHVQVLTPTGGVEDAVPLALDQDVADLPAPAPPVVVTVARLVPLRAASLSLVGSLLTLSVPTPEDEAEATAESVGDVTVALLTVAASADVPTLPTPGDALAAEAGGPESPAAPGRRAASPPPLDASTWMRHLLGNDRADGPRPAATRAATPATGEAGPSASAAPEGGIVPARGAGPSARLGDAVDEAIRSLATDAEGTGEAERVEVSLSEVLIVAAAYHLARPIGPRRLRRGERGFTEHDPAV